MKTDRSRRPFDLSRARLSGHWSRTFLLKETGASLIFRTDAEALAAFQLCAQLEGIIPALEPRMRSPSSGHRANQARGAFIGGEYFGRGDKDIFTVADHLGGMAPAPQ